MGRYNVKPNEQVNFIDWGKLERLLRDAGEIRADETVASIDANAGGVRISLKGGNNGLRSTLTKGYREAFE